MESLLLELLNATLSNRPLEEEAVKGGAEADWQRCFDLVLQQQVLAMTFPAMSALPQGAEARVHAVVEMDGLCTKYCSAVKAQARGGEEDGGLAR